MAVGCIYNEMSRTSLGQKNELRQREEASSLKQLQSLRRVGGPEAFQTHITIEREVDAFLHMRDRYQKMERENRFFDLEGDAGQCFNSVRDGYGINIFKNGDRYIGFWEKNTMHGMGIYVFKAVDHQAIAYLGQFYYGKFHGLGKLVRMLDDQNGEVIYRGTWEDGKKSDQGYYFYENPSVYYQGGWLKDEKNGEGKLVFANGEYSGLWQNNLRNGQGRLRKSENGLVLIYEGVWSNDDLKEGEVIYQQESGAEIGRYRGQLIGGKRHGNGVYTWRGATFQGIFEEDRIKGEGTLKAGAITLSGFFYSNGESMEDLQNLSAVIQYENKDVYEGIVSIRSGRIIRQQGSYRFANGDVAEGQFNDNAEGRLDGSFFYKWRNGDQTNY